MVYAAANLDRLAFDLTKVILGLDEVLLLLPAHAEIRVILHCCETRFLMRVVSTYSNENFMLPHGGSN